jgi:hypothetical protein
MRKLLIGPALTGAGWLAGSYYGANAQQIVHKSPEATYEGVEHAIDNVPESGTTQMEGGKSVPYRVEVDRTQDQRLTVHLLFDGREGASTDLVFTPQNNGSDTLITAKAHGNREVLGAALAGTSKARLAYAPDWMLNLLTIRPLLQQVAGQIERGEQASIAGGGMTEADWESRQSPEDQRKIQEWRQYDASRPMVNPDADAQKYMNGESGAETGQ